MPAIEPKSVSRKHDAIIDYLLLNPMAKIKDLMEHFGYSQSWLSIMMNSDAFRMEYKRRAKDNHEYLMTDINAHLRHVALKGLNRIDALLDTCSDIDSATNATDKLLSALGYSSKNPAPAGITNNNLQVNFQVPSQMPASVFDRARLEFQNNNLSPRLLENQENVLPQADDCIASESSESGTVRDSEMGTGEEEQDSELQQRFGLREEGKESSIEDLRGEFLTKSVVSLLD